jgi:hypothetical protein
MEKPSLDFLPYSTERRSIRRDANPDPVPPPKEWNTRNPCVFSGVGRSKKTTKILTEEILLFCIRNIFVIVGTLLFFKFLK